VQAAAQAANADEFVRLLPHGYDTPINERGTRLSGGQRQRLAIARAFLKDAPILILDEATVYLDAENEALIQDALIRLMRGRTVLIIAHRMAMIYQADQIIVLDQGRAVASGNHRSLLAADDLYRALVSAAQAASLKTIAPSLSTSGSGLVVHAPASGLDVAGADEQVWTKHEVDSKWR
jgi:ABC-type multidrug transport system fused ATPase/permease subunit